MNKKVLIADDEGLNRYLLKSILAEEGIEVIEAENGKEALEKALADPPDMIISDILMPVMDGYTLCRHCKSSEALKRIPFLFYTASYTKPQDEQFALDLGAERFILKPQDPDVLLKIIEEVWKKGANTKQAPTMPLGQEMEFFRQYNEILFKKLEKKLLDLEAVNRKLNSLEEQYRLSFANVTDVIYTIDRDLHISSISPSIEKISGYQPEDLVGRPVSDLGLFLTPESFQQAVQDIQSVLAGGAMPTTLYRFVSRDGSVKLCEVSGSPIMKEGKISGIIAIARDVTQRKQAEDELRESEERYRTLFERTSNPILINDSAGNYIGGNHAALQFLECTEEQLRGKNVRDTLPPGQKGSALLRALQPLWESGGRIEREYLVNGKTKVLDLTITPCLWHGRRAIFALGTDLTDRLRAEEELRRNEARFRDLFQEAPVGYFEYDRQGLITRVNRTELDMLGYRQEDMVGQPVWHFLVNGEEARQQILAKLAGTLPPFVGMERTYRRKDGSLLPVLIQDRLIRDDRGTITGIRCAIQDIADRKRDGEMLLKTMERLRQSLAGTVHAISLAVETRDPYTAGHQRRAADLARAIATDMGFPEDRIDFVRIATTIHDLGKISVPAEILSKPTQLRDLEYELIKSHPQAGHDILRDIDFPWPVAEVILQHHERMNGSGYPQGLAGEAILLEARILSVADVVEAIASHRPYRAALGVDAALEEISKNSGILYDATVVDVCLRLFREKGYRLP